MNENFKREPLGLK